MKSLSVVLPNFNHARWLGQSLRALAEQAGQGVEIVVVDDGSTDESVALIKRLAQIYPFVRLMRHERNMGVAAAIRTGLSAVTGEFLFVPAADDLVLPGLFQCAVSALRAKPEAALFCSQAMLIDAEDRIVGFRPTTFPRSTAGYVSPEGARRAIRTTDNWFVGTSVIYRREFLEAVGYFDDSLGSLADGLTNRLLAFRHGFWFDPRILSAWRRYANSYSGQVAMSQDASEKSLAIASRWIVEHFPDDIRKDYAELFDRRLRYNLARLRLLWGRRGSNGWGLTELLKLGSFDRVAVKVLSRIPLLNTMLVLAWLTLRLRPFGLNALAAASWRNLINGLRRNSLQIMVRDGPRS
jgi:glycosyltransferase involved in cell wall biosynthesis